MATDKEKLETLRVIVEGINQPPIPKATPGIMDRPRMGMPPRRTAEDIVRDIRDWERFAALRLSGAMIR